MQFYRAVGRSDGVDLRTVLTAEDLSRIEAVAPQCVAVGESLS
jgi:hypothetical protein